MGITARCARQSKESFAFLGIGGWPDGIRRKRLFSASAGRDKL